MAVTIAAMWMMQGGPWDPLDGGYHGGWDWSPADGQSIGGGHAGVGTFVLPADRTVHIAGVGTVHLDAENFVIEGTLNAVDQNVVLGAAEDGSSVMEGGAGGRVTLLGPAMGGFATGAPTFDWNDASPPGSLYDIQISTVGASGPGPIGTVEAPFDPNTAFGLATLPTQFPAAIPLPEEATVFWRVRAGANGPWSETWEFRVDSAPPPPPELLQPAVDGVTSTAPGFSWSPVLDFSGVTYTLVVDDDCGFGSAEISKTGLTDTYYVAAVALPPGEYCWRVTAVDGAGNMSSSPVGRFRVVVGATTVVGGGGGGRDRCLFLSLAAPPAAAARGAAAAVLLALIVAGRRRRLR